MLRNFEKFEVGHWYVYCGEAQEDWGDDEKVLLDRKANKCVHVNTYNWCIVKFSHSVKGWGYENSLDYWVEVEAPDTVIIEGDRIIQITLSSTYSTYSVFDVAHCFIGKTVDAYKEKYKLTSSHIHILKRKEQPKTMSKEYKCPKCGKKCNKHESKDNLLIIVKETCPGEFDRFGCISCGEPLRYAPEQDEFVLKYSLPKSNPSDVYKAQNKIVDKKEKLYEKYSHKPKYLKFGKEKKK